MLSYIIEGGNKLQGTTYVSGSKNASLPILAASILSPKTTLYNAPEIYDTEKTIQILNILGCKIKKHKGKLIIDSSNIKEVQIPDRLMRELRSSVILAGALISRFKKAVFSYPGGCDIGARPIDLHLNGFRKLGINVEEEAGYIKCTADKIIGADINLDFPSVGATENIMLASVFAEGETTINNAALEPEIVDLQKALNKMGAKIQGAGTNTIKIKGVKKLKEASYNIMPDRIEAGTLLVATAMTGGNIQLKNAHEEHLIPVIHKLEEMGCKIGIKNDIIELTAPKKLKAVDIKTMPYPGFPTDMQSVFGALFTTAKGTSLIIENIFENRYKYTNELKRMGAKITIEGKTAIIKGTKKLTGADVNSTDLRGGAALVVAGLAAKGTTTVNNIEYVLRGYEDLAGKLNSLGANITKVGERSEETRCKKTKKSG